MAASTFAFVEGDDLPLLQVNLTKIPAGSTTSQAVSVTGATVHMVLVKRDDGAKVERDLAPGEITDAAQGECQIDLSGDALTPGSWQVEMIVTFVDDNVQTFPSRSTGLGIVSVRARL